MPYFYSKIHVSHSSFNADGVLNHSVRKIWPSLAGPRKPKTDIRKSRFRDQKAFAFGTPQQMLRNHTADHCQRLRQRPEETMLLSDDESIASAMNSLVHTSSSCGLISVEKNRVIRLAFIYVDK